MWVVAGVMGMAKMEGDGLGRSTDRSDAAEAWTVVEGVWRTRAGAPPPPPATGTGRGIRPPFRLWQSRVGPTPSFSSRSNATRCHDDDDGHGVVVEDEAEDVEEEVPFTAVTRCRNRDVAFWGACCNRGGGRGRCGRRTEEVSSSPSSSGDRGGGRRESTHDGVGPGVPPSLSLPPPFPLLVSIRKDGETPFWTHRSSTKEEGEAEEWEEEEVGGRGVPPVCACGDHAVFSRLPSHPWSPSIVLFNGMTGVVRVVGSRGGEREEDADEVREGGGTGGALDEVGRPLSIGTVRERARNREKERCREALI